MPVYTSDALILRTYKLAEADRIVVFLTKDRGKKRGVAKGARRARSRFTGTLEPLTRAGVAYYERELRDLVRINYVETQRSALSVVAHGTDDAFALGHAEYFAELIDEWAPEGHADERLYRLGSSVIDALADGIPTEALARYFEFWLLRLQGVYELDRRLSDEAQAFLTTARSSSPFALSHVEVSRSALRELETAHRALISMHLEKDLKSVRVLREMRR
jgi:DNA repair protein RecO (recombination protein O)